MKAPRKTYKAKAGDKVTPVTKAGLELAATPTDGTHAQKRDVTCVFSGVGEVVNAQSIVIDYDSWGGLYVGVGKVPYDQVFLTCDAGSGWAGTGALRRVSAKKTKKPKRHPGSKVSEGGFAKRLMVALCKIPGVQVHRQNSGRIVLIDPKTKKTRAIECAPEGAADISGILGPEGLRIEIETKSTIGKIRPGQEIWAAHIERSGGIYLYAPLLADRHVDASVALYVMTFNDLVAQRRAKTDPLRLADNDDGDELPVDESKLTPVKWIKGVGLVDQLPFAPYHFGCDKVIGKHEATAEEIMRKHGDGEYGNICPNCHDWLDDGVMARKY